MHFTYSPVQASTTFTVTSNTTAATIADMTTKYKTVVSGLFTIEDAPVRVGFGGLTPTSVNGHRFDDGDSFTVTGWDALKYLSHIRGGATNAKIWVTLEHPQGAHPRG